MSAADYYGTYNPYDSGVRSSGLAPGGRHEAPLPPIPKSDASPRPTKPSAKATVGVAPVVSPFDDQAYPPYPSYPTNLSQPQPSTRSDHLYSRDYHQKPYSDPFADPSAISLQSQQKPGFTENGSPLSGRDAENNFETQRPDRSRRRRWGKERPPGPWWKQKISWVVWTLTTVQVIVFIIELIRNCRFSVSICNRAALTKDIASLTGSPIEIHPQFNPMIGPSPYVLINMGARYVPCMRNVHLITDSTVQMEFPCPNATTNDAHCQLSELCGFNGVPNPDPSDPDINRKPEPNQWFRFIIPMFLHAGIIHIGFNMLLQVTLGREMELKIGSIRFALVYFSAGIFGFILGGNFAATGIASTGASGALFGILALTLLDLLYNWNDRPSPIKDLLWILADVLVSFVLGLLPGLDNFSHIGGFLIGLTLGICILHSPTPLRERFSTDAHPSTPYSVVPNHEDREVYDAAQLKTFARQPVGFFKGRKPLWWGWWLIRAGALVGILIAFILLLRNFYVYRNTCGWCRYLSCLPINNWCDLGNLQSQSQTSGNSNNPRALFGL